MIYKFIYIRTAMGQHQFFNQWKSSHSASLICTFLYLIVVVWISCFSVVDSTGYNAFPVYRKERQGFITVWCTKKTREMLVPLSLENIYAVRWKGFNILPQISTDYIIWYYGSDSLIFYITIVQLFIQRFVLTMRYQPSVLTLSCSLTTSASLPVSPLPI